MWTQLTPFLALPHPPPDRYAEVNTQQPCVYYEGYPTLPDTSNYWYFATANFSRSVAGVSFQPPAGCDAMCDVSGSTYEDRLERRWAAGVGGGNLAKAGSSRS